MLAYFRSSNVKKLEFSYPNIIVFEKNIAETIRVVNTQQINARHTVRYHSSVTICLRNKLLRVGNQGYVHIQQLCRSTEQNRFSKMAIHRSYAAEIQSQTLHSCVDHCSHVTKIDRINI